MNRPETPQRRLVAGSRGPGWLRRPAAWFRRMGLQEHVLLALLPAVLIYGLFHATWVTRMTRDALRAEKERRAHLQAELLARECVPPLETFDRGQLQSLVNTHFLQDGVVRVDVIDGDGKVLAADDPRQVGHPLPLVPSTREVAIATVPIHSGAHRLGTVQVGLRLDEPPPSHAVRQGLMQGLLLLAALWLPARFVTRRLSVPLQRMAKGAEAMGQGRMAGRVAVRDDDALAPLARSLNTAAERIERRIEAERAVRTALLRRVRELVGHLEAAEERPADAPGFAGGDGPIALVARRLEDLMKRRRSQEVEEQEAADVLRATRSDLAAVEARIDSPEGPRGDFLAVASHELRGPLSSIKAFAAQLHDDLEAGGETHADFIRSMDREADRLHRMIDRLLDLFRMEAGRVEWRNDRVTSSELSRRAVEAMSGVAREHSVRLEVQGNDFRSFVGDRERLVQALGHLLENAIQASPAGEVVRLFVLEDPERAHLMVSDHGPGIEARFHGAIFEQLRKVRPDGGEGTGRSGGSGLGLPLARAVTTAHGGRIEVESAPGRGSRFHFIVPLEPSPPPLGDEPAGPQP